MKCIFVFLKILPNYGGLMISDRKDWAQENREDICSSRLCNVCGMFYFSLEKD